MQIAGWLLGPVRRDGVWHHARDARCAARRRRHVKTHFKNQSAAEGGQLLSSALFFFFIFPHPALFVTQGSLHYFVNLCFHSFVQHLLFLCVFPLSRLASLCLYFSWYELSHLFFFPIPPLILTNYYYFFSDCIWKCCEIHKKNSLIVLTGHSIV